MDVADPRADWTVAEHVACAERALREIAARARVPLVVGGTGMYLRGLLRGLAPVSERDPALRDRLRRLAQRFGPARLHRVLVRLDPDSAARLASADTQRIVRALEMALGSGDTWSRALREHGTWSGANDRIRALKVGLDLPRDELGRRLDERVERFFRAGLVDEVRALLTAGVPASANAFKAIGYREVLAALRAGGDPDATREAVARSTRRFAKRQRTWFRKEPGVVWLDASQGLAQLAAHIETLWRDRDRA